jgi:competence CoiA-like predicted nuclease
MIYALDIDGGKRKATPGARAICPGCGSEVLAKCGMVNVWHWAHVAGRECDDWHEPMTPWHLDWQSHAKPEHCEVWMGKNNEHRADICGARRVVVELQNSHISADEIRTRERFYGERLVWIVNAADFAERLLVEDEKATACPFPMMLVK